jgi:hypothetical protein
VEMEARILIMGTRDLSDETFDADDGFLAYVLGTSHGVGFTSMDPGVDRTAVQ